MDGVSKKKEKGTPAPEGSRLRGRYVRRSTHSKGDWKGHMPLDAANCPKKARPPLLSRVLATVKPSATGGG